MKKAGKTKSETKNSSNDGGMAFTLWALLEAGLLVVNAICVLHEQRFLAKGEKKFQNLNCYLRFSLI